MEYVVKKLGFQGAAWIDTVQLLCTGGSFNISNDVAYMSMIHTPPDTTMVGKVLHASGTQGYTGSLSFDIDTESIQLFSIHGGLLERNFVFDVTMNDGETTWRMEKCQITSLKISGTVGGLLSSDVSFISTNKHTVFNKLPAYLRNKSDYRLYAYWYSGKGGHQPLTDWSLTMNQNAELMYKNEQTVEPAYMKIGEVSYTLSVSAYDEIRPDTLDSDTIKIATKSFNLSGQLTSESYRIGGLTELGEYSYVFETSSSSGKSNQVVIT